MDTLIITTNDIKHECLRKNKNLENVKYITFSELKKKLYFSYDIEAIYEVMKRENVSYEMANIYLSNLYYLNGSSLKVLKLKSIFSYLKDKKLLIEHSMFKDYIKNCKVFLYGIEVLSKEEKKLLSEINYEIKLCKKYFNQIPVYEAETLEEEVNNLAINIVKLIKTGVKASNIYIVNLDDEYRMCIEKIFSWYNIPTNICIDSSLSSSYLVKEFLNSSSIEDGILKVQSNISNDIEIDILNKIISISSRYIKLPYDEITKSILREEFKNINVLDERKVNAVEEGNIYTLYDDNSYVFVVGCNEGVLPKIYKDEDYLSDKEKSEIGISTSIDRNSLEKDKFLYFIIHTKNLVLSYKKKTINEIFYPSSLLESLNIKLLKVTDDYSLSNMANMVCLGYMLDDFYKYNVINKKMNKLLISYPQVLYGAYSNKFTGISKKLLSNDISISYTSLDCYNRCAFRYYLNYVLKVDAYENTFNTYIGKLFHYILSKAFLNDFNLDVEWNKFIENNYMEFCSKDKFFLLKFKNEIMFIIDEINRQSNYSSFKDILCEEEICLEIEDGVKFKGVIDKILYNKSKKLLSIIDYKTGTVNLSFKYLLHGINMQIPVYVYLISKYDKFKDYKVVGFYLQKLIFSEISNNEKKSYDIQKRDSLKLQGYSLGEEDNLKEFDSSYRNSDVIKSMKVGNNGFYQNSKVLNQNEIDNMLNVVDKNINLVVRSLKYGDFSINPKRTFKDNVGCEFCKFHDICFHTEKDFKNIIESKDMDFLGSDLNA